MNNYLSQEEKQMMADLAHLLAENDMKALVRDASDVLNECQDSGETVTIVRRSVPDNFWLAFRELVRLGIARDSTRPETSDEYDQCIDVSRPVLEALLLVIVNVLQALLSKDGGYRAERRREYHRYPIGDGLEP